MPNLLSGAAVGAKDCAEAAEILQAYIATGPVMVLSYAPEPPLAAQRPKATGAGDNSLTDPM
jgi:hypothetical protein